MLYANLLAKASLAAALTVSLVQAVSLPTISTIGSRFYDSNGKQFFVKGIAYQLTPDDPLVDTSQCTRDASLMKSLGANSVRVYHIDPTADHSGCMDAFASAGIYVFIDLDTFTTQITPVGAVWSSSQYGAFGKVLDAFASYTNTLGYFVGNEVIALANQSNAAPYIKAATRDMKAYRDSKGYRKIPIGYSAADIAELRPMLQDYLACGTVPAESIDFFGLNAYEWCGDSTYQQSGYQSLNSQAAGYSVPIFFSETGCNKPSPRTFQDQTAILGNDMNGQWSGAIIYEWIEEQNSYGLISYGSPVAATATGPGIYDGFSRSGTPTPVQPDFSNLQAVWSTMNPTGTPSSLYTPNVTPPVCPSSTPSGWLINGNVPLPTINEALSQFAPSAGALSIATPTKTVTTGATVTQSASPSATSGGASGRKEITGMSAGLVIVMIGFTYWL